jgi:hypothetical protein
MEDPWDMDLPAIESLESPESPDIGPLELATDAAATQAALERVQRAAWPSVWDVWVVRLATSDEEVAALLASKSANFQACYRNFQRNLEDYISQKVKPCPSSALS